jgi:PKD repeat protein
MKCLHPALAVAVLSILIVMIILPAGADQDLIIPLTAPAVIDTPGHYRLTNDLTNSSINAAIKITSPDVILDGNGHTLTGGVLEYTYGVLVANEGGSLVNISICNLTTNKWERGIYVQNSSNVKVFNCTSTENNEGLSIIGIQGASIEQCNLSLNTLDQHSYRGWGVNIVNSDGIEVKGNDIHSNKPIDNPYSSSGIFSTNSRVVISGNRISDHDGAGILLGRSDQGDVIIRDNVIDNFEGKGIYVDTNVNEVPVLIVNNTINAPEGIIGILAVGTNSVNLTSNMIVCKNRGITIVDSMNDTLSHNTIHGTLTGFGLIGHGNISYYYHSIDETNTVDGKPIRYFKDIEGPYIDASVDAATVIAVNCTNGRITGKSLSKNNDGVIFVGCRNMTVVNSTFNNNFYGIETFNSETCAFRDIGTSDNDFIGFASNGDSNIGLLNYTSNNNVAFGLILQNTEGFMVQDSVVNSNGGGIDAGAGISASNSRGSITGVTASENQKFGILSMSGSVISINDSHISDTHGNGLQAEEAVCVINNSEIAGSENTGVTVYNKGASVQMSGCTIRDSDHAGIWFSGAVSGTPSVITNNIFNNTQNVLIEEENDPVTWNVTKTSGINIAGGPYLGGNYWAKPDGTGWSQVTPDRGDGFCNAPFVIDEENMDYLPLHTYTPKPSFYADFSVTPTAGTAPFTVKCTDKSIGNPSMLVYNFGDGVNVTGPNPVHTYRFSGIYTITLSIMKYNATTNSIMSSTMTKTNVIIVNAVPFIPPVAKFTASPVNGTAPLKVTFSDQSTGSLMYWNYDFGDGINATGKNLVHTYQFPGVYNVTLTVLKNDAVNGSIVGNASVQKSMILVKGI